MQVTRDRRVAGMVDVVPIVNGSRYVFFSSGCENPWRCLHAEPWNHPQNTCDMVATRYSTMHPRTR